MSWHPHGRVRGWRTEIPDGAATRFHRVLPGYRPTPLHEVPELATKLGVGRLFVKDESQRLGLPAFKALGASWAIHRAVQRRDGRGVSLVTASDGNHGRAVARFAREAGLEAHVYVPRGVSPAAISAIRDEGAMVRRIDGTYDDAVAHAAQIAQQAGWDLVQDTAWVGYEEVPSWIVDGYDTMFVELDQQLAAAGSDVADLLSVPTGVGSLLQAALRHYRHSEQGHKTAIVSAEPDAAASVQQSLIARSAVSVPTQETSMAGLNCGTPSALAWPLILKALDGAVAISDASVTDAGADLERYQIDAGPCGAASLAAMHEIARCTSARRHLGLDESSVVALLITEGSAAS